MGIGRGILMRRTRHVRAIDRDSRLAEYGVAVGDIADEASESVDWVSAVRVSEHIEDDIAFMAHLKVWWQHQPIAALKRRLPIRDCTLEFRERLLSRQGGRTR
jgi:hypothetical protein